MRSPPRILIVDDDPALLIALPDMLALRLGPVEIETASSARTALERMAAHEFDVALTDLKMPDMDGITFTQEAHRRWPQTAIFIVTAASGMEQALAAVRAGARGTVRKPVQRDSLTMLVKQALESKNEPQPSGSEQTGKLLDRLSACQEAWHKAFEEHRRLLEMRNEALGENGADLENWLVLAEHHGHLVQQQIELNKQMLTWSRVRQQRREERSGLKERCAAAVQSSRRLVRLAKGEPA